jgi:hypothetical protein
MAPYDNTKDSDTMPPGYGLRDFVTLLVDLADDGVLDKKGRQQLTGGEHEKLRKHGRLLSSAVEELAQILTDGQPPHIQEYRLAGC